MVEIGDKTRASIRSVGLSRLARWWIGVFGKTELRETVDIYDVRYVRWRGTLFALAKHKEAD